MPKQNFIKVIYMTLSNIIGDAIVVFGFYYIILSFSVVALITIGFTNPEAIISSASMYTTITVLELVAMITILFTIVGIIVGTYYLKKELNIRLQLVLIGGIAFFKDFYISTFRDHRSANE